MNFAGNILDQVQKGNMAKIQTMRLSKYLLTERLSETITLNIENYDGDQLVKDWVEFRKKVLKTRT